MQDPRSIRSNITWVERAEGNRGEVKQSFPIWHQWVGPMENLPQSFHSWQTHTQTSQALVVVLVLVGKHKPLLI